MARKKVKKVDFYVTLTQHQLEIANQIAQEISNTTGKKSSNYLDTIVLLFDRFSCLWSRSFKHSDGNEYNRMPNQYVPISRDKFHEFICKKNDFTMILPYMKDKLIEVYKDEYGNEHYVSEIKAKKHGISASPKKYRFAKGVLSFKSGEKLIQHEITRTSSISQLKKRFEFLMVKDSEKQKSLDMINEQERCKTLTLRNDWLDGYNAIAKRKIDSIYEEREQLGILKKGELNDPHFIFNVKIAELHNELDSNNEKRIKGEITRSEQEGLEWDIDDKISKLLYQKKTLNIQNHKQEVEDKYKKLFKKNYSKETHVLSYLKNLKEQCHRIINGYITVSKDADGGGRIYTPFTNLHGDMDEYIIERNSNRAIFKVDVRASQMNTFYGFIQNPNIVDMAEIIGADYNSITAKVDYTETTKIKSILENDDFYDYFSKGNFTRKEAKKMFTQMMFGKVNDKTGLHNRTYEFEKEFTKEFPITNSFLLELKRIYGNNTMSITLRRIESDLFIRVISPILDKHNINFYTKHDSIQFIGEENIKLVESLVKFKLEEAYNLRIQLHVEDAKGNDVSKKINM